MHAPLSGREQPGAGTCSRSWPSGTVGGAERPLAILVTGAPGSGKSTVGALVAAGARAALLDLDTATAALTAVVGRLAGADDLDDPVLAGLTRAARYETITLLAEDNLRAGGSVVLVAPFTTERRDGTAWEELRSRLVGAGAETVLVWLRVPAEEVGRRVAARGAARDAGKLSDGWAAGLDLDPPVVGHLECDALLSPAAIADLVLGSPAPSAVPPTDPRGTA